MDRDTQKEGGSEKEGGTETHRKRDREMARREGGRKLVRSKGPV